MSVIFFFYYLLDHHNKTQNSEMKFPQNFSGTSCIRFCVSLNDSRVLDKTNHVLLCTACNYIVSNATQINGQNNIL